uniref:Uncharacterized protein n=1 Tax=Klebsiella pneumoniae TaxID=573 RepID=A0A8B0SU76_KLEPN|nr:hypothetical protein [Klebsiella pneumoniae]
MPVQKRVTASVQVSAGSLTFRGGRSKFRWYFSPSPRSGENFSGGASSPFFHFFCRFPHHSVLTNCSLLLFIAQSCRQKSPCRPVKYYGSQPAKVIAAI